MNMIRLISLIKDNERMGIENSLTKFEILFKEYLMSYEYKSNYRNQIYFELNRASSGGVI